MLFETTVTQASSQLGEYDLETIRGVPLGTGGPFGTGRGRDALETELGAPEGVVFRIVELPDIPVTQIRPLGPWEAGRSSAIPQLIADYSPNFR